MIIMMIVRIVITQGDDTIGIDGDEGDDDDDDDIGIDDDGDDANVN